MKVSEAAREAIALSEAINNYWDTELPKRHRDYPLVHEGEDSGPPPPEEAKLRGFLDGLPEDVVYALALVMQLRWGNFEAPDLARRYEAVKAKFEGREDAVDRLATAPSLGNELTDGLAELRKKGIDVDHLSFALARSGG